MRKSDSFKQFAIDLISFDTKGWSHSFIYPLSLFLVCVPANVKGMMHVSKENLPIRRAGGHIFLSVAKPRPCNGRCCCSSSSSWRYFCIIGSMHNREKLIKTKVWILVR